jgi:hypothetical protein
MSGVAFGCHGWEAVIPAGQLHASGRLKDADPDEDGGHGDNVDRHRLARPKVKSGMAPQSCRKGEDHSRNETEHDAQEHDPRGRV